MGKLIYIPLHGRAEPTRMLLNYAGIKFEDERIPFAEFGSRKAEFPAGQVPVWINDDGKVYNQSIAIVHALAREHGFAPKNSLGEWANTWVSETIADFWNKGLLKKLHPPTISDEDVKVYA